MTELLTEFLCTQTALKSWLFGLVFVGQTLSMMRRSFDVVSDMATAIGEPVDPRWAATLATVTPDPLGWFHGAENTARMGNVSHACSFCGSNESHGLPTVGDCQGTIIATMPATCEAFVSHWCSDPTCLTVCLCTLRLLRVHQAQASCLPKARNSAPNLYVRSLTSYLPYCTYSTNIRHHPNS